MAHRDYDSSEYGGKPGIIQPGVDRVDALAAEAGLGHDSTEAGAVDRWGVRDVAMVVRRAGIREGHGLGPVTYDQDGVRQYAAYDEDMAREDYLNGEN